MSIDPSGPAGLLLLAAAGLVAGVVNTLAGGGSLLTLPALVFLGLPAGVANGTNRLSVLVQSLSATATFARQGERPFREVALLLGPTLVGAGLGAYLATRYPGEAFRPILGGVLVAMGLLSVLRPRLLEGSDAPRETGALHLGGLFLAGAYGGFAQAGVGFLLLFVLVGGLEGQIAWLPGAALAVGAGLGGVLGARLALSIQARWLRFPVAAFALAAGLHLLLR